MNDPGGNAHVGSGENEGLAEDDQCFDCELEEGETS